MSNKLFSFFDAIKWCWHSGFKRTDMYSVVSFLACQIFWCSNGAYFVTLTAYYWINSFICWIQVSLRFSAKFFWENTCLFFHFLQQAPCNIGFLHFFFNNFATLDSYIRGTKVNFSSIFLFLIFKMWVWYICSDQFYSSFHDFKSQGSKLVSCKRLSAGWSKIMSYCDSTSIMWVLLCRNGAYFHSLQCHWLPLDAVQAFSRSKFV